MTLEQENEYLKGVIQKIGVSPDQCETIFMNALCNGLSCLAYYNCFIERKKADYIKAAETLESPCYEDILLAILKNGGELCLHDEEGEERYYITLKDVHERILNVPKEHLFAMITENDDATTADIVLQTVFLNEVVFG